ncbi:hypothetical protein ACQEVZ_27755 [Dactylosporangium sp. CA-152071]|uniref:hypothetical protein n=1 Tax=Dactylosporangium sp. CA-152071 TaxID=3239933 RepID=UPI003D92AE51
MGGGGQINEAGTDDDDRQGVSRQRPCLDRARLGIMRQFAVLLTVDAAARAG